MYFDWITWSIWLVGFIIMIIWIWIPIKEFKQLLAKKKEKDLLKINLTEIKKDLT
jgi:hypothetical protein